jgi:hypothetical protein
MGNYSFIKNGDGESKIYRYSEHFVEMHYGKVPYDEECTMTFVVYAETEDKCKEKLEEIINEYIENRIITSFVWDDVKVYLSKENQQNWKAIYDFAIQTGGENLPVTLKIGEDDNGSSVYKTFKSRAEMREFYEACLNHIVEYLTLGWGLKDNLKNEEFRVVYG